MSRHNQIYFVFCPRDGESTTMKGNSILSLQEFKKTASATFPQEITDPSTGKKIIQENTIPGVNYNTEVLEVNGFTDSAIIQITRKTKTGDKTSIFKVNDTESKTYMDDKYIVKFGVAYLEDERYATATEATNMTKRNIAVIGKLTGLDLNIVGSENESNNSNSDEMSK